MDMLKRAAGKIYGWIEPHMDNDKMLTKIKRVYICTDAAARDKCAEMYTDIIAKILLTLLVTCILAVILVAKEAFAPHQVVLTRDGYGGDVSTVTLETDIDGERLILMWMSCRWNMILTIWKLCLSRDLVRLKTCILGKMNPPTK